MPTKAAAPQPKQRAPHLGPERRRPQALDAALAIAVQHGVGAITLGSVADRLKVTRPVIYTCFGDRKELIEALLSREGDRLLEAVLAALHSARGDDPEAVFIHGYQALLRVVAQHPDSWRLLFTINVDPEVSTRFTHARAMVAESASRWIRPVLTQWWDMRDADRKLPVLVELFMSSCEAAVRVLLDTSNPWSADDLGDLFGRTMCRAFSAA
jgi:AcrR family transcriptional regulator